MATQRTVTRKQTNNLVGNKTLTQKERLVADKLVEKGVECAENVDKNYMTLGAVLYHLKEKGYYRTRFGYENFKDFIDDKIPNCGHRKGLYLVRIFEFTRKDVIPKDALKEIGWSKLKEIVPILWNGAEIKEWIQKARELPFAQLQEAVRKFRAKDKGQLASARKLLPVRILTEDIETIMGYLQDVADDNILDTKDKGEILWKMVSDWMFANSTPQGTSNAQGSSKQPLEVGLNKKKDGNAISENTGDNAA